MNKKQSDLSRRRFIGSLSALPVVSFLKPVESLFTGELSGIDSFDNSGPLTYRLFVDDNQLSDLRNRFANLDIFADLREELDSFDRVAERAFLKNDVQYNDHLIDLNRIGHAAPKMAFLYLMTDDVDAARLAVESIETIMRFPTWDYFLEDGSQVIGLQRAPSSVVAVALCSDWLGDFVDGETRKRWIETMGEKGCEACFLSTYGMRYPKRVKGWTMDLTSGYFDHRPDQLFDLSNWPYILDKTNLKAVPASALAIGAAAYEAEMGRSEKTDRWLEQSAFSIKSFGKIYAEDGSYNENLSYANYTSEHLAQGMEILTRFRQLDLTDEINWTGFVDFMYGMSLPTTDDPYGIANFGDAGNGMMSSVPFWIANNFKDPRSMWFAHNMSRAHNIWSVLWHNEESGLPPNDGPSLYRSKLDWITARTGYEPDDLVVAMRSGPPANHEHADRNSIIVKCYGDVLVADPYRPPYANTDPSWRLRLTEGHSALLVDGTGHQYHDGKEGTNPSDAHARIVRTVQYGDVISWSSDATQAYALVTPDIDSVVRTVIIVAPTNTVVIIDKVKKKSTASFVTARYYAKNNDGNGSVQSIQTGFSLIRPTASVDGIALCDGGVDFESGVLDIAEDRALQHPFVDVRSSSQSRNHLLVTVLQPRSSDRPGAEVSVSSADGIATVRLADRYLRIYDSGPIPEFELS
ncbi:MAG: hypothetical protein HKN43_03025 [Rhodothermales bacterium]|nr:hypothetical protein [Rhodothermales bacterium]